MLLVKAGNDPIGRHHHRALAKLAFPADHLDVIAMNMLRNSLGKLPAPVALIVGFSFFICIGIVAAKLAPPARDLQKDCEKTCHPLAARLEDDKTYPLSARTQSYPKVCKCGAAP